jgi:hypothetical protein
VDQLVHAGDKGDFLLLSTGQQTLVEGLHDRIAAGGDDDGKVEGLAQLLNAGTADLRPAPNGAVRLPFSRSDADVGHDLGGLVELGKISEMSQLAAVVVPMPGMDVSSSLSFLSPSCLSM